MQLDDIAMRIFLTGGNGFVGRSMLEYLASTERWELCASVRAPVAMPVPGVTYVGLGEVYAPDGWIAAMQGTSVVVHTAASVHRARSSRRDLAAYRLVNVEGSLNVARQAAAAGVRRFVYLSTVKVHGENSVAGSPFRATDDLAPVGPYAQSKLEAEQALRRFADASSMELVIVRPPLVYGPGVGANFLAMMQWLVKGVPMPLGGIESKRSLVSANNLVDLLRCCCAHPSAAGGTFLVSDGEDLTTSELLLRLGDALGHPARLFGVPSEMLRFAFRLIGRSEYVQQLLEPLQIDLEHTRDLLGWRPRVGVARSLALVADWYLRNH